MVDEDSFASSRKWLRELPRGGLAKVSRGTEIPSARLSLFRRAKQNTLSTAEHNALLNYIQKHLEGSGYIISSDKELSSARRYLTAHHPAFDNPPITFHLEYPDQFTYDLRRAENLKVMGTSLRRLTPRRKRIKELVSRNKKVQVLFIDPTKSGLLRYETIQEFGDDSRESIFKFSNRLLLNARWWFELQSERRADKQQIEIKVIEYPLAFGIDLMDLGNGKGSAYVQFYPLVLDEDEEERPIIEIRENNLIWYEYYKEQFERHWELARVWDAPPTLEEVLRE